VVAIVREPRVQPITGLARLAVTQRIGQHDEVTRGIQRLSRTKQLARKFRPDETNAASARPMNDQHRITHNTMRITLGLTKRMVVDTQLGQGLARSELEVAKDH